MTTPPTLGAWVNARPMSSAKQDVDSPAVLLYFQEAISPAGDDVSPLWIEGQWTDDGALCVGWLTPFGYLGVPIAWAPLPKVLEDSLL